MRSVAFALGWELWRRHRLWFVVTGAYLVTAAVAMHALALGELTAPAAVVAVAPLGGVAAVLLAFFTYSLDMDLMSPGSGFPGRAFTLPVRTAALAGWPMLYGAAASALLWLAPALLVLRPCGLAVPLAWPALLAAAFTAWMQALLWWPVGWPLLRTAAVVLLVSAFSAAPQVWAEQEVPEGALVPALAALLPAAYLTAVAGVARARRGDGQAWPSPWAWAARALARSPRPRPPFASAGAALLWWEWRRAVVLPLLMALLLPFFVAPFLLPDTDVLPLWRKVAGLGLLPLWVAFVCGTGLGNMSLARTAAARDRRGALPAFLATRPVSCAAFVAAKLKVAALATLALWALPALAAALALSRPDNAAEVRRWWGLLLLVYPPGKAAAAVALAALALLALTWKALVENMALALAGRPRLIQAAVFGGLGLLPLLGLAGHLIYSRPEAHAALGRLAWWAASAAVALKLLLAGWAVRALHRRRLVAPRALTGWLAVWLVLVVALCGALAWLVPPGLASLSALALASVLLVPLARPALAPLALEWDRHR